MSSIRVLAFAATVCGAAAGIVTPADAATTTGTIAVTATVLNFCVLTPGVLAFGNYSSVQLDGTAALSVSCTTGTTYNVGLSSGLGTGATVTNRKMTGTGATLSYGLYRDSAHTNNWGETIGTDTVAGTGTGLSQSITVYGRIPANQLVAAGAYADSVTATVTY